MDQMLEQTDGMVVAVYEKLIKTYATREPETFTRILFYLDEDEKACRSLPGLSPGWKTLKATLRSEPAFKNYADRLGQQTKMADMDRNYRQLMYIVHSESLQPSAETTPRLTDKEFELLDQSEFDFIQRSTFRGLGRAWPLIPNECHYGILNLISKSGISKQLVAQTGDSVTAVVKRFGQGVARVSLEPVQLAYEEVQTLQRWWSGEISGKRCAKNVLENTVALAAGVGAGIAGTALGLVTVDPVRAVAGGLIGATVVAHYTKSFGSKLTEKLFDLPKEEVLRDAYRFLGVDPKASNAEINARFRQLCLTLHPDKGGSLEMFQELQVNMGIIKADRGEL